MPCWPFSSVMNVDYVLVISKNDSRSSNNRAIPRMLLALWSSNFNIVSLSSKLKSIDSALEVEPNPKRPQCQELLRYGRVLGWEGSEGGAQLSTRVTSGCWCCARCTTAKTRSSESPYSWGFPWALQDLFGRWERVQQIHPVCTATKCKTLCQCMSYSWMRPAAMFTASGTTLWNCWTTFKWEATILMEVNRLSPPPPSLSHCASAMICTLQHTWWVRLSHAL
jgi:hypothetical protein